MSGIDETSGAGSANSTNRSGQTDGAGEAAQTDGAEQAGPTKSAVEGRIPEKSSEYRPFMDDVLGRGSGDSRSASTGASGEATKAYMLTGQRAKQKGEMAERKQQLGEALDTKYEEMGGNWDAESGLVLDKWSQAWQDDYSDISSSTDAAAHARAQTDKALYQNGRLMNDDAIEEVVADHRDRLKKQGAFEGWETDDIDEWQEGVTAFLKQK
ncbi:MAG: hypothetical protein ABEN55_09425, partial [Bradymonadaceae bacterium]